MPSLKDIRRRIGSVKNTQKITRAMKLVSAAKFARANAAVVASRPYGQAFDEMVARLISIAGEELQSPLLETRDEKKSLVVLLATDRGFCGGLNSNLLKYTQGFISEKTKNGVEVDVMPLGRRAKIFSSKMKYKQVGAREKVLDDTSYDAAKEFAAELTEVFSEKTYDRVYVAFVQFQSALSQNPQVATLFPLSVNTVQVNEQDAAQNANILVEPDVTTVLDGLLKRTVASRIYRIFLEGSASEHGARMTAMDSATNNANEVIRKLTIQYNRARQAAITKELIEITSGAEAL